jgi:uncharacterized protein (DUF305 family)
MATKKPTTPKEEKLEKQDFDLFEALAAMDRKDYNYLDSLTEEQQRKFVPYMMTHWMSAIKASGGLGGYYVMSTEYNANKHLFNEYIQKHPKLQWMMLCASSPGMGKQFHQWIPHLSTKVTNLKETPKPKEVKDYYTKIYPKADSESINMISEMFMEEHKKKVYLAKRFPEMKIADIEVLAQTVTDDDIRNYERELGNE